MLRGVRSSPNRSGAGNAGTLARSRPRSRRIFKLSIGRPRSEPPSPPEEVLWRLTKGPRVATATLKTWDHGYEVLVHVDGELIISHMHRHHGLNALRAQVAAHRAAFLARGWQE